MCNIHLVGRSLLVIKFCHLQRVLHFLLCLVFSAVQRESIDTGQLNIDHLTRSFTHSLTEPFMTLQGFTTCMKLLTFETLENLDSWQSLCPDN